MSKIIIIMGRIQLKDKFFTPYIPYKKLETAIDKVAEKINRDFKNTNDIPVILCVLNGSLMFTSELMKRFKFQCELATVRLSSYEGTSSTGATKKVLGLSTSLKNRTVIIIEDIVDTGKTIHDLYEILNEAGAIDVRICTMLLKTDVYSGELDLDYVAMEIENKFIVGFGLDYEQLGRNLTDIYILD